MGPKDHGLTVGQLTMTIGALLIASLLWTTINKKNQSQENISNIDIKESSMKGINHSLASQLTYKV